MKVKEQREKRRTYYELPLLLESMLDLDAILARIRYTQTTSTSSHRLHWLNRDCRFCCTAVVAFAPVSATICAAAMATGLALVGRLRLCFKRALVTSSVAGGRLISG